MTTAGVWLAMSGCKRVVRARSPYSLVAEEQKRLHRFAGLGCVVLLVRVHGNRQWPPEAPPSVQRR
jgi:hypothetical protein